MNFNKMKKKEIKKYIHENYSNPSCAFSFSGVDKIYNHIGKSLKKDEIKSILAKIESYTLMKQEKNRKKNKIFTPIIAFHFLDNVQADLVDISRISEDNNNIKFLLCIIDVFSRYSWVYPLLNKTSDSILESLSHFFRTIPSKVSNISFDFGGEFRNNKVISFLRKKREILVFNFRKQMFSY